MWSHLIKPVDWSRAAVRGPTNAAGCGCGCGPTGGTCRAGAIGRLAPVPLQPEHHRHDRQRPTASMAYDWWADHRDDLTHFDKWRGRTRGPDFEPGAWRHEPDPLGPGGAGTMLHQYERVQCQFFDYLVRKGYEPPTDGASKAATLDFCWSRFRSQVVAFEKLYGFGANEAEALILHNEMNDTPGEFFVDGVGLNVVQWAIALVVVNSSLFDTLFINGTGCDSVLPTARARIDAWRRGDAFSIGLWINRSEQVSAEWFTPPAPCGGLPYGIDSPTLGATGTSVGESEPFTQVVRISPDYCVALGVFADAWLTAAHRAYWAMKEGAAFEANRSDPLEEQVKRAGRLALAASASVAQVLTHEIMHLSTGWGVDPATFHCTWGCCQTRASARFEACLAAMYGLTQVSRGVSSDGVSLDGTAIAVSGLMKFRETCDDLNQTSADVWIQLASPGIPTLATAWSVARESVPQGCG